MTAVSWSSLTAICPMCLVQVSVIFLSVLYAWGIDLLLLYWEYSCCLVAGDMNMNMNKSINYDRQGLRVAVIRL